MAKHSVEVKAPKSSATKAKSLAPNLRELYINEVDNIEDAEESKIADSRNSKVSRNEDRQSLHKP